MYPPPPNVASSTQRGAAAPTSCKTSSSITGTCVRAADCISQQGPRAIPATRCMDLKTSSRILERPLGRSRDKERDRDRGGDRDRDRDREKAGEVGKGTILGATCG